MIRLERFWWLWLMWFEFTFHLNRPSPCLGQVIEAVWYRQTRDSLGDLASLTSTNHPWWLIAFVTLSKWWIYTYTGKKIFLALNPLSDTRWFAGDHIAEQCGNNPINWNDHHPHLYPFAQDACDPWYNMGRINLFWFLKSVRDRADCHHQKYHGLPRRVFLDGGFGRSHMALNLNLCNPSQFLNRLEMLERCRKWQWLRLEVCRFVICFRWKFVGVVEILLERSVYISQAWGTYLSPSSL
jgi:hypothetical protein